MIRLSAMSALLKSSQITSRKCAVRYPVTLTLPIVDILLESHQLVAAQRKRSASTPSTTWMTSQLAIAQSDQLANKLWKEKSAKSLT